MAPKGISLKGSPATGKLEGSKTFLTALAKGADYFRAIDIGDMPDSGEAAAMYAVQVLFSIGSAALTALPGVGAALSAIVFLYGTLLFPGDAQGDLARGAAIADQRIDVFYVHQLTTQFEGIQANTARFNALLHGYNEATDRAAKDARADTLRSHYMAFMATLETSVPTFQHPSYALSALPVFVRAANLHLMMLKIGYTEGKEWGLSDDYVNSLLGTAMMRTGQQKTRRAEDADATFGLYANVTLPAFNGTIPSEPTGDLELDQLAGSIHNCTAPGCSSTLLGSWEAAYAALSAGKSARARRDLRPYTAYVEEVVRNGRSKVKPKYTELRSTHSTGLRAYAQYDAAMISRVFRYSAPWPEMVLQNGLSQATLRQLDREIWSGPYERLHLAERAADVPQFVPEWNATHPAAVLPRGLDSNLTAISYTYDREQIHSITTEYLNGARVVSGNVKRGKYNETHSLGMDEYITSVDLSLNQYDLWQGFTLRTNRNASVDFFPRGYVPSSGFTVSLNHSGYALSSLFISRADESCGSHCYTVLTVLFFKLGLMFETGLFIGWRPAYLKEVADASTEQDQAHIDLDHFSPQ